MLFNKFVFKITHFSHHTYLIFIYSQIMERSIRSVMNQAECRLPELPIDNPEITKFFHHVDKIDCGNPNDDWVTCEVRIEKKK